MGAALNKCTSSTNPSKGDVIKVRHPNLFRKRIALHFNRTSPTSHVLDVSGALLSSS